jgi:CRP-like cAMP-binding protein
MNSNPFALSRFLDRLLRHSTLSNDERKAILDLPGHVSQVQARYDVVSPGEVVDHACLVVKGLAGRFDQMTDGRRQTTALHIAGDMCDLHSVVQPRPSWSITALTTTTILHVPHRNLRDLVRIHPGIGLAFWRDTAADASILSKWLGNFGRKDAQSRVAHLFCEMAVRMEAANLGTRTSYQLPMTQEQLSDATGMTAVHVNRTLQMLRATGTMSFAHGLVEVSDWEGLKRLADFTEDYLLMSADTSPQHHSSDNHGNSYASPALAS